MNYPICGGRSTMQYMLQISWHQCHSQRTRVITSRRLPIFLCFLLMRSFVANPDWYVDNQSELGFLTWTCFSSTANVLIKLCMGPVRFWFQFGFPRTRTELNWSWVESHKRMSWTKPLSQIGPVKIRNWTTPFPSLIKPNRTISKEFVA